MPSEARRFVAPLYLLACLVLGGNSQAFLQNLILQAVGIVIIGWVALSRSNEPMSRDSRLLLLLAIGAFALVVLQAAPWSSLLQRLGVRVHVPDDFRLLGQATAGLPLSLMPSAAPIGLIPPLAMFCAMMRVETHRLGLLLGALLAGTLASVVVAALQVAAGLDLPWGHTGQAGSWLTFGFFANGDQMAGLLLIALPFTAAIGEVESSGRVRSYSGLLMLLLVLLAVFLVGFVFAGSQAGYALLAPVLCASALFLLPRTTRLRRYINIAAISSLVASIVIILRGRAIGESAIFARQVSFGAGISGMLLIALFLGWWVSATWDVWRRRTGGRFVRAASIATAAVLIESLLGFQSLPAAISVPFAMCIALLANRQAIRSLEGDDLRPARHVVVG